MKKEMSMEINLDSTDYDYIVSNEVELFKKMFREDNQKFHQVFHFVSRDWKSMQKHDFYILIGARVVVLGEW